MADRRMFTTKVTDNDNFVNLSSSAQALYLHLTMGADDDGFCNQISASMFKAHASVQDLEALLEKRYLIQFENGVIVIKHWRMANALRADRYTPTAYQEEYAQLKLKDNKSYSLVDERLPDGCQVVASWLPQKRIEENRKEKNSIEESGAEKPKRFYKPTLEEVKAYCEERNNGIDAQHFIDYYEARGWMIGKNHMKNWKAAVRTWEGKEPLTPAAPAKKNQIMRAVDYHPPKTIDTGLLDKIKGAGL